MSFSFPGWSVFLPYFRAYSVHFSFFQAFQCFSPYFMSYHVSLSVSSFVSFLAIFQILKCEFLILLVFQFSRHIPGPTVCISPFSCFSVFLAIFQFIQVCVTFSTFFSFLATLQVVQCVFLIFHVFHCFSPYSSSYNVCVPFYTFFSFLTIIQVLWCKFFIFLVLRFFLSIFQVIQCLCLIFHVFQFSCPNPDLTVCISHILCYSLPYSRSYSVCFSFCAFFRVCRHIPSHTVFVSLPRMYVCQLSCHNPGPIICKFHISRFSLFLSTFQFLLCVFLILQVFQCFLPYSCPIM